MTEPTPPFDSAEVQDVLEAIAPHLRTLLARYQIPPADAEDLVQEAVLATLPKWRELSNKEGWLVATMRNLCSVHQRRQKCWARLIQSTDTETMQSLASAQDPPQEFSEVIQDLRKLLAKVDERERRILCLKYIHEMGPSEVASKMGCHPASVRKTALRAIGYLKTIVVR